MINRIIYLTAGEYPSPNNLLYSQVVENVVELKRSGVDVSYLATIPLLSYIKDWVSRGNKIAKLARILENEGVDFRWKLDFIHLRLFFSFRFRDILCRFSAMRLRRSVGEGDCVIHCRSYFAARIATLLKRADRNIRVSFDMRSILSGEIPIDFDRRGVKIYGRMKCWEHEIIKESDVTFMTTDRGCNLLRLEHGVDHIEKANIAGFASSSIHNRSFDEKWELRMIAYVGSLNKWNSKKVLGRIFSSLDRYHKKIVTMSPAPDIDGVEKMTLPYAEMAGFYASLLALVVPGFDEGGYFSAMKLQTNIFSTKAAEALSMGIPIIVNEKITELAQFVEKHQCGIVVDVDQPIAIPSDRDFWKRICANASAISGDFVRESVLARYRESWARL